MCGLTGFWQRQGRDAAALTERVVRMANTLRHRGPDDEGSWVDPEAGVALGFRRLAILDLSPLGHQPMSSADGRYTCVFNGEIYNYLELKAELRGEGQSFRGTSDTEVMLAGFTRWGIEGTLRRLLGMFAIAVWDRDERTLTLARDRLGKKPMYYGRLAEGWVFGSELKALRAHPDFQPELDRESVAQFLRYSYVPTPRTIYKGVRKLPPACFATFRASVGMPALGCYWDVAEVARGGQAQPLRLSDAEATDALDRLLRDAVRRRMIADVPLGAFLSGGLDSSTVVALMQQESTTPVRTFTLGFHIDQYNEAEEARSVARHLRTDHTELYVTAEQAQSVIPELPAVYDEPFADSSQIPTYLVSKLARSGVTVTLSGDGGDELFAGYNRYFWGTGLWKKAQHVPVALRRLTSSAIQGVSPQHWDALYGAVERLLPDDWRLRLPGDKLHKVASLLTAPDHMEVYRRLVSAWHDPAALVIGAQEPSANGTGYLPDGFCERMMFRDLITYLPDDILTKVDRASMAVSLEVRAPLLDHRVVEWAWALPRSQRIRHGSSKWLLRQVLYRYVPRELIERPKTGFGIPIDHWLRGPLRGWASDLLDPERMTRDGLLRAEPIQRAWREHLSGYRNEQARLWPVLMLEAWRRHWRV